MVNVWWIYLIEVFSNIEIAMWILVSIFAIVCSMSWLIGLAEGHWEEDDAECKILKSVFKISSIVSVIAITIAIAIPSEKTMYTMFVSSYLTEENIAGATESVTDVIDYIFEKVEQLHND